jgi:hypothetical protein
MQEKAQGLRPWQSAAHPLLQIIDDMGYDSPGSLLGRPSCVMVAKSFEEAPEREVGSKVINASKDGVANNVNNTLLVILQL